VLGLGEKAERTLMESPLGLRVLVVEDDFAIRNLVKAVLSRANIRTEEAGDGEEALRLLSSQHYDVVVLDLMLPEVSGFELLERIRQQCHGCVVVLTAAADHEIENLPRDLVFGVIRKPFNVDDLANTVLRAAARRPEGAPALPELQNRPERP
jgi:DNA-binding response OmpR family regulator